MKTTRKSNRTRAVSRRSSRSQEVIELVPSKLHLRSILVPIDFSPESEKALKYAALFAEQFGAQLILIHVVEPLPFADLSTIPLILETQSLISSSESKLAEWARRKYVPPNRVSKTLVRQGQAHREITDAATKYKVDLIIIATHGYTGLQHALIGSTAERVVRHAQCPVLTIRTRGRSFA